MEYTVRPAQLPDLGRIQEIYGYARDFMEKNGNPNQWGKTYPPIEQLQRDIAEGKLFVITDGQIVPACSSSGLGRTRPIKRLTAHGVLIRLMERFIVSRETAPAGF